MKLQPYALKRKVSSRPGITRRLARAVISLSTACQEWLEAPDKPRAKTTTYIILALAGAYLAGHLAVFFFR